MDNLYYNKKKLKKIRNKRTQKIKKIWGGILTGVGAMTLVDGIFAAVATDMISGLFFLVPGLILLLGGIRQARKWDRYEAIIDNHGNTSIPLIAERMGLSQRAVYSDLQEMIQSDFFIGENYNIEAYIDAERELLVMTSGGRPLKPLPQIRPDQKPGAQKPEEEVPEAEFEKEPEKEKEDISVKLTDLEMIQKAIAETPDDEVRGYLYGLEGSVRRIDARIKSKPELRQKTSIKRLYKFYLPQIMELIRKYQAPETSPEMKGDIKEALKTSASALANIEADLLERDQMDMEVDIEVLKNMFAQDGLLGKENLSGGAKAASAQGQKRSAASQPKAQTAAASQGQAQAAKAAGPAQGQAQTQSGGR